MNFLDILSCLCTVPVSKEPVWFGSDSNSLNDEEQSCLLADRIAHALTTERENSKVRKQITILKLYLSSFKYWGLDYSYGLKVLIFKC